MVGARGLRRGLAGRGRVLATRGRSVRAVSTEPWKEEGNVVDEGREDGVGNGSLATEGGFTGVEEGKGVLAKTRREGDPVDGGRRGALAGYSC